MMRRKVVDAEYAVRRGSEVCFSQSIIGAPRLCAPQTTIITLDYCTRNLPEYFQVIGDLFNIHRNSEVQQEEANTLVGDMTATLYTAISLLVSTRTMR
jgi:hypothetical protein